MEDELTLPQAGSSDSSLDVEMPTHTRYRKTDRLGAGAMGEVTLCEDRRIGREVALKVATHAMRDQTLRERFVREARIQARLEHPSIVPVYDIGRDEEGNPFFTMKRVRGRTLREIIEGLRKDDFEIDPNHYTRRRLLSAFATICMTVHYAHTRGILHRDLKPSNIMLGDYGEIYVLDWGVAREASVPDEPSSPTPVASPDLTAAGDIVGTPGYIAPEHVRGEALDARADVYSLGAILFELLTLERLHSRDPSVALSNTTAGIDARPSTRVTGKEIPPELDAICVRATALASKDRYSSARELHDAVDRYLEGDRDLERRRETARSHTRKAHSIAGEDAASRTQAMAEVSRALAFDPTNADARRLLVRLLTEPPRETPEEVKRELELHYEVQQQRAARGGALLYAMFFFWAPVTMLFAGERRGGWFFGLLAVFFAISAISLYRASRLPYSETKNSYVTIVMTSIALSGLSGFVGPLVLVPVLVMTNAIGFLLRPQPMRRRAVLGFSMAAIAVPQLLEWTGIVPPSAVLRDGKLLFIPRILDFTEATHMGLFLMTIVLIVAAGAFFGRFRDSLTLAEEKLSVHAWQLRQLLPEEPRSP